MTAINDRRKFLVATAATLAAGSTISMGASAKMPSKIQETENTHAESVMPFHRFRNSDSVFLMIDFQQGIAKVTHSNPIPDVISNALTMLAIAKVFNMPVVFTSSEENLERKGTIFPALAKAAPVAYEKRIKRSGIVDAFDDADFLNAVKASGKKNIIIGGISTEECIAMPALAGLGLGYNVKVIADACASFSQFTDNIQFNRMLHYGVDVTTVRQLVADMVETWNRPEAAEIVKLANQWKTAI